MGVKTKNLRGFGKGKVSSGSTIKIYFLKRKHDER
jgi:hypothetical protein